MSKILLIDDSSVNNFLLESILEEQGYEIFSSNDPEEGLEMVSNILPDLVLLDVMMPIMDGFDVLTKIRENDKTKDIPVIMVTADLSFASKKQAKEIGISDYILKPIDIDDVCNRVNRVLLK